VPTRPQPPGDSHAPAHTLQPPRPHRVSFIYGKAVTFGGPFARLVQLQRGDKITVSTGASGLKLAGIKVPDKDYVVETSLQRALDPRSTRRIEDTIREPAGEVTVVIVTHNMQQAQRVSDHCAFFLAAENTPGHIVEAGPTEQVFDDPKDSRTADYVHGRFG
jgi:hypothetical protein